MKTLLRFSLAAMLLALVSAHAQTTVTWNAGGAANDLTDPANWSSTTAPAYDGENFGDYIGIVNGGNTVTVTSDATGTLFDTLQFGAGSTNGTLNLQSGGALASFSLTFGADAGSTGTGAVSGTGSLSTLFTVVGGSGTGSLTISGGGTVEADGGVTVAQSTGSHGTFLLTGAGSSLTGGVGGGSGTASITVTDSATIDGISSGDGNTTATISNSAVVNGSIQFGGAGTSSFTIGSGATLNGGITLGATTGGSATGDIDGGSHTILYGIGISGTGTNSLTVHGGAVLDGSGSSNPNYIGYNSGESGTMTLTDGSSWTSNGGLTVGHTGTGTLTISDGASASFDGGVTLGENTNGYGTLNVDGGTLTVGSSSALRIGTNSGSGGGTGILAITNGGVVTSETAYVAAGSGTTGTVTVDGTGGASTWNVGANFEVGATGSGSVTVSNGGTLTNSSIATVGSSNGSNGTVTITGTNSSWTSTASIYLGNQNGATGTITLAHGGDLTITNGILFLGNAAGSTGTLNIGAAANQSAAAPGTLTFTDPASGSFPTTGVVRSLGGTGTVVFNHTSNNYTFSPVLDFNVNLLQKAGTTVLTGGTDSITPNTGSTTITGGTLQLGVDQAFGTGALTLGGGTLALADHTQTAGALTVSGNSFIDFGAVNSALTLADSSALTWSGSLAVTNFTNGADFFRIGTDASGLTGTQLNLISIDGYTALMDSSGYLTASTTAVPEPAAYAAVLAAVTLVAAAGHRRQWRLVAARKA